MMVSRNDGAWRRHTIRVAHPPSFPQPPVIPAIRRPAYNDRRGWGIARAAGVLDSGLRRNDGGVGRNDGAGLGPARATGALDSGLRRNDGGADGMTVQVGMTGWGSGMRV